MIKFIATTDEEISGSILWHLLRVAYVQRQERLELDGEVLQIVVCPSWHISFHNLCGVLKSILDFVYARKVRLYVSST
jgi:hypothetical protein